MVTSRKFNATLHLFFIKLNITLSIYRGFNSIRIFNFEYKIRNNKHSLMAVIGGTVTNNYTN
jgi:hypothetical protein